MKYELTQGTKHHKAAQIALKASVNPKDHPKTPIPLHSFQSCYSFPFPLPIAQVTTDTKSIIQKEDSFKKPEG